MKTLNRLIPAILLATTVAASALVEAANVDSATDAASPQHWSRTAAHARAPFRSALSRLDLSAEQKSQIQSIFQQARPQFESLMAEVRNNRAALEATAPSDSNYATLLNAAKANADARVQLQSDMHSQIFAVLTPAQQAQLPQLLAAERSARAAQRADWKARHGAAQP